MPHIHVFMTAVSPVVAASYMMCMRVCVVNGTRKILPWTMWLSAKEHTFAKEVAHAFIYACIHIIHGNSIFLDVKVCGCNSARIYRMVIAITRGAATQARTTCCLQQ